MSGMEQNPVLLLREQIKEARALSRVIADTWAISKASAMECDVIYRNIRLWLAAIEPRKL